MNILIYLYTSTYIPPSKRNARRMLTYADVCGRMRTYADVCWHTYRPASEMRAETITAPPP